MTGRRAVLEAIRSGGAQEVLVGDWARAGTELREIREAAVTSGAAIREGSRVELDGIGPDHQGVAAKVRRPRELSERELAERPYGDEDVVVVLDGITDPQNLGAAARSAEAAGVALLVTRERRAAGVTSAAVRASAGALVHLPVARVANLARAIERLKQAGFFVVGLDASAEWTILDQTCPDGPVVLVVGSEGTGLSRLVRERCDLLVALPMRGRVESLNASAALAAALYGFVLRSRKAAGR